ncbi:MAG: UDP-2,3-diacylglucosamine diphosphatase, partial [Prevotellaceae bacterium]|nr:UDP-2,3-diacylglucosamine diphosphatase [Prevotellaceae bacterium]
MQIKDKYYFAADVHLGLPVNNAEQREQRFVAWLNMAAQDAKAIFLLGDIFDFWCEYKKVVPKGFIRTLGKLAELADIGIEIHFLPGNHDLWTFGYISDELGIQVHHRPLEVNLNGEIFYLAHGDNVGKMPKGYRHLRSIFTSCFFQKCFASIHPRW